jgi:UrcA family protein
MFKAFSAVAALAVASVLLTPTVSQAAERTSVRVSYADLNLATDFGKDKLQRRIAFAASTVCDPTDGVDLKFARAVTECRNVAIADAQPAFAAAVGRARHGTVEVLDGASLIVTAQ